MIQTSTVMNVIDNSGARYSKIIKLLGGNKNTLSNVGDLAVVTIKKIKNKESKVKKGEVHKFRILRHTQRITRKDGMHLKFDSRGGIILNNQLMPLASRILGPLPRELKKKYGRTSALAKKLI
eukprot:Unigene1049_Nuclearia_a/m.3352 Unigene1049_Nuclearia_a/g.3352  ORF Unigene1049_Nuclearia_a/g.3352 Unigene1049_Nuclearia_a/m.3352 type:complete len:123 (+) Unigene1049_Nuclearia_a:104-472(+)